MLSGKQKRYLRSLGNNLKAIVIIGKDNLTYNIFNSLEGALKAHELVKVSLLKTCDLDVREVAIELAANTSSEVVQIIGRTIILYKQSKDRKITLP
ncbi:MAG: ribosome assembly RNA-binding protein YhbY [Erysipelotrichaceae bacterium]|nr:ribosome assembly RNA-binding protein YhbY [Erysipelotrichaceae bacterium]